MIWREDIVMEGIWKLFVGRKVEVAMVILKLRKHILKFLKQVKMMTSKVYAFNSKGSKYCCAMLLAT